MESKFTESLMKSHKESRQQGKSQQPYTHMLQKTQKREEKMTGRKREREGKEEDRMTGR